MFLSVNETWCILYLIVYFVLCLLDFLALLRPKEGEEDISYCIVHINRIA